MVLHLVFNFNDNNALFYREIFCTLMILFSLQISFDSKEMTSNIIRFWIVCILKQEVTKHKLHSDFEEMTSDIIRFWRTCLKRFWTRSSKKYQLLKIFLSSLLKNNVIKFWRHINITSFWRTVFHPDLDTSLHAWITHNQKSLKNRR